MAATFSLIRHWALKHWDTCLLTASGILFLWQATAYFLPVSQPLPPLPKLLLPSPAVYLAHPSSDTPQGIVIEALPQAQTDKLLQKQVAEPHPKRYPPKKPKPQLKPASIHLNSVTLAQLDLLPGVGPKLAKRILTYRKEHGPFQSIEDLKNVKGIGDKNFAKMQQYLAL